MSSEPQFESQPRTMPTTPSARQAVIDGRFGPSFVIGPFLARVEAEARADLRVALVAEAGFLPEHEHNPPSETCVGCDLHLVIVRLLARFPADPSPKETL